MRTVGATLFLAALLATPARAEDDGLTVGVRAGLGFPFGKVDGSTASSISDYIPGNFPLWLELGYRFDRHWSLVGFFQYGPATTDACPANDCNASDQRLGVTAIYRFERSSFTPWMGFGTGYEWLNVGRGAPVHAGGLELNLQAGGDFRVSSAVGIGPYLCFSVGQFTDVSAAGLPQTVLDKTSHGWVQVGVKGTFDF